MLLASSNFCIGIVRSSKEIATLRPANYDSDETIHYYRYENYVLRMVRQSSRIDLSKMQ